MTYCAKLWSVTVIWAVALVLSGWQPYDRATWWMEVAPVLQGDPWDTQWDMLMCLIGAAAALLLLSRLHDWQVEAFDA